MTRPEFQKLQCERFGILLFHDLYNETAMETDFICNRNAILCKLLAY